MTDFFQKISEVKYFKGNYETILIQTSVSDFPEVVGSDLKSRIVDWDYMLFAASALAQSEDSRHLDIALRVANGCILSAATSDSQHNAAAVVYSRLSNHPAVKLAIERNILSQDYKEQLPSPLLLQTIQEIIADTVVAVNGTELQLNKFQKALYSAIELNRVVSASAPTSAGKSFILNTIVEDILLGKEGKTVIYIVPTRALINQIEDEFRAKFANEPDILISSVPRKILEKYKNYSKLFILTQERLHWLMLENGDLKVDYVFIDEAQKIADDTRGILLQQKIEELQAMQPNSKFIYCSALSDNPQELLPNDQNISSDFVITRNSVVSQNLIWVSKVKGKPRNMTVSLMQENQSIAIGAINFETNPGDTIAKLSSDVVLKMSNVEEGGVMIYVSEPTDAEKIATNVAKSLGSKLEDDSIAELIKIVKNNIHPEYVLAKVLEKGVAFHYGNMPHTVRSEIERQFKNGSIKCLVCTATLLEGVNLPAKTIYITSSKRSRQVPMSESDFWNLAGRAGRLTKEFQGNIVCINPVDETRWPIKPLWSNKHYKIKRSIDKISADEDKLIAFIDKHINDETIADDQYEYVFSYYYGQYVTLNGSFRESHKLSVATVTKLKDLCSQVDKIVQIPNEILLRNPGISPLRQQRLVDRLKSIDRQVESIVPPHPEAGGASDAYVEIACRAYKYLNPNYHANMPKLLTYVASLAVQWMCGLRLPVMISKNTKSSFYKDKSLSSVVRGTMRTLEEDIRFTFAKYLACYVDLLRHVVLVDDQQQVKDIPDLRTYLEFGVSKQTLVSLIILGFDRNDAITLLDYIGKTDATEDECEEALKLIDISTLQLEEAAIQKIKDIKNKKIRSI